MLVLEGVVQLLSIAADWLFAKYFYMRGPCSLFWQSFVAPYQQTRHKVEHITAAKVAIYHEASATSLYMLFYALSYY